MKTHETPNGDKFTANHTDPENWSSLNRSGASIRAERAARQFLVIASALAVIVGLLLMLSVLSN